MKTSSAALVVLCGLVVPLLGCTTRARAPRATCGAGWSPLTADRALEAATGIVPKDATVIERVEVAGVDARVAEALRRELVTRPGEAVDAAPLGDDLRRLWRLGVIADAKVELRGGVVRFVVELRPQVRSVDSRGGDELARARFRRLEATSFEPARVRRMADALRESYVREGRLDAEVETKQRTVGDGVDVCVAIDPGPRVTIAKLEFPGRKAVSKSRLIAAMASKKVNRVGRTLDEEALDLDELYMQAVYWDLGYANIRFGPRKVERRGNKIEISIPVHEGPVFRIGKIETTAPVTAPMTVRAGDVFSRTKLADLRTAIQESDRRIYDVMVQTRIDTEARTIDITFEIEWRFPWDALRSWLSHSR